METIVVTPPQQQQQHRNQYCGRDGSRVLTKFGSPTGGFRDISCKFQAREGILSTPFKSCSIPSLTNNTPSPKKQTSAGSRSEGDKYLKCNPKTKPIPITSKPSNHKSSPIPINSKGGNQRSSHVAINSKAGKNQRSSPDPLNPKVGNQRSSPIPIHSKAGNLQKSFSDDLSNSELWAGPTYCNSPPPSSLPIPKFSLRQKSVSLELPEREFGIKLHPVAKSAPSSPRGGSCPSPDSFFRSTALATKDLRRILNLDTDDE